MRTMIIAASLATVAALAGCGTTSEPKRAAPTASAHDAFTAQCIGYGYISGTPDVAQCAERLAQDVRTRAGKRETAARESADAQFDRASGTVTTPAP